MAELSVEMFVFDFYRLVCVEKDLKKGQMCEGIVEKVKFPNKGIVKVEDSEVTVKNTIPGQKVSFVINKKRKGKAEGRLLEILEKSELENAEANCPHYGV